MLNNKSILITGGTGSLGKELTKTILKNWPDVKRLVIYSRDEQKQYQMLCVMYLALQEFLFGHLQAQPI